LQGALLDADTIRDMFSDEVQRMILPRGVGSRRGSMVSDEVEVLA